MPLGIIGGLLSLAQYQGHSSTPTTEGGDRSTDAMKSG